MDKEWKDLTIPQAIAYEEREARKVMKEEGITETKVPDKGGKDDGKD